MNNGIADRGLRPAAELYANKEHGTRERYLAGCKCFYCRRANSDYERERKVARAAGDWNGIVSAGPARKHLKKLSSYGIGRRQMQVLCGVGATVLHEVKIGKKTQIRARTERLVLGVAPVFANMTGSSLVDAEHSWKLLNDLLAEGFTKAQLAAELGYRWPALQLHKKRITATNRLKVFKLWRKYMTGGGC